MADRFPDEASVDAFDDPPAPAPSRDDTRYPRGERGRPPRPQGGRLRSLAVLLAVVVSAALPRILGDHESDPEPESLAGIEVTPEVHEYLDRVETICRAHDREVSIAGKVSTQAIVQSETTTTSRIASLPAPSEAREIRDRLLAARRDVDRLAIWQHRIMSRSTHPQRAYRRRVRPRLRRRVPRMYQTFASFGIDCSVG